MRLLRRSKSNSRRQRPSDDQLNTKMPTSFSSSGRQPLSQRAEPRPERPGHFWLQRLGLLILLVALVALAVNVLSLSPSAKVIPLTTTDNQAFLRPTNTYAMAANTLMKSSIWNRSKLSVNAAGISHQLLAQFPELSSASVTIPLMAHQPLVYIEPAQPALILAASNGNFVVDNTGKALLRLSSTTKPSAKLVTLTDQSGLPAQLNNQVLPASNVGFIQTVVAELGAKGVIISGMTLPATSSELDVHLVGQVYFVKFNLQSNDPRGQSGTFLATISGLKRQNIVPTQYVDVRVDGRAYYQ